MYFPPPTNSLIAEKRRGPGGEGEEDELTSPATASKSFLITVWEVSTHITGIHHFPLCSFVDKHNNTASHYTGGEINLKTDFHTLSASLISQTPQSFRLGSICVWGFWAKTYEEKWNDWNKRKAERNVNFQQREKKKDAGERFPWSLRFDAEKKKYKVLLLTDRLRLAGRVFPGQVWAKMQADKNTESCSVFASPSLFLPVSFSSLSLLPHHLREVNDSAVKLESRLFDLDSKPAFLNKYSVAQERWRVPSLLQITGYVWGGCFSFGPSQHHYGLQRGAYRK